MKRKIVALLLSAILLCGITAATAFAKPWKNWELWSTFGFGSGENSSRARWLCSKVDNGKIKLFSEKGFETEEEAAEFMEKCFTDKEKELILKDEYPDGYGYDEENSEKIFKDKLYHPVIEYPSFETDKLFIINVHGAHRLFFNKTMSYDGHTGPKGEPVSKDILDSFKVKIDPCFRSLWVREGDRVSIDVTFPDNYSAAINFKTDGAGGAHFETSPISGAPHQIFVMGTTDATVTMGGSLHPKSEF